MGNANTSTNTCDTVSKAEDILFGLMSTYKPNSYIFKTCELLCDNLDTLKKKTLVIKECDIKDKENNDNIDDMNNASLIQYDTLKKTDQIYKQFYMEYYNNFINDIKNW